MKKHRILKFSIITILLIGIISFIGFGIYVSDYYKATDEALAILEVDGVVENDNTITLYPHGDYDTGIIFYPGAKVEAKAYLPLLNQLRDDGYLVVLVEMPFNLAFFDINAADKIYAQYPSVENWFLMGHSLGGAMASSYASRHQDELDGLILLGAYIYGDYSPSDALTIYGTFNAELETNINYTENIVVIEGGNHAQFGNYGKQKGDPDATISSAVQQAISVAAINDFIHKKTD